MNANTLERAYDQKIELRSVKKPGYLPKGLVGYAVPYDKESRDMGGFTEIISRGSMKDSLKAGLDVRLLFQHQSHAVMAREQAGNLVLREDSTGVYYEADLLDIQLNRDAYASIEAGNLDAMSFGMPKSSVVGKFERSNGKAHFIITRANIVEISVVTWAAYQSTLVAARSMEEVKQFLEQGAPNQATPVGSLRARHALTKRRYR